jgi:hypothetical protein
MRWKLRSKWQHTLWQRPWHLVHIEYVTSLFDKHYVACKRRLQSRSRFYEIPCEPEIFSVMEYICYVASGKLNRTHILCIYNICTEISITVFHFIASLNLKRSWLNLIRRFQTSHTHTHTNTHTHSTSSRKRLTIICMHTSKYTSLRTCVFSPHNMSSSTYRTNKYCLPPSC